MRWKYGKLFALGGRFISTESQQVVRLKRKLRNLNLFRIERGAWDDPSNGPRLKVLITQPLFPKTIIVIDN